MKTRRIVSFVSPLLTLLSLSVAAKEPRTFRSLPVVAGDKVDEFTTARLQQDGFLLQFETGKLISLFDDKQGYGGLVQIHHGKISLTAVIWTGFDAREKDAALADAKKRLGTQHECPLTSGGVVVDGYDGSNSVSFLASPQPDGTWDLSEIRAVSKYRTR